MFGERLSEFVLSIDILDEDAFFELLELITVYVKKHLDVTYFSVLEEDDINEQRGLRTLWTTRDEKRQYILESGAGRKRHYTSHSAYTLGENKPVWAVSATKGPLHAASGLKDLWSDSTDLPPYSPTREERVCTSVMHPLRREGRAIGVVEFASEKYVEPAAASFTEATTLATVISRAYRIYDVSKALRGNTRTAIKKLGEALENGSWTRLALPQVFVAFPGAERHEGEARKKHEEVIETIKGVVDEFADTLTAVYWDEVSEAGDINEQVIRDIGSSDYGLCYFSEPADDSYTDNANVLFEAGMMQALRHSPVAPLSAWIPIRERESGEMPFDIKSERTLHVDRIDGKLDAASFAEALRKALSEIVQREHAPEERNGGSLARRVAALMGRGTP